MPPLLLPSTRQPHASRWGIVSCSHAGIIPQLGQRRNPFRKASSELGPGVSVVLGLSREVGEVTRQHTPASVTIRLSLPRL